MEETPIHVIKGETKIKTSILEFGRKNLESFTLYG